MAKRRSLTNEKNIAKHTNEGRGKGIGKDYVPWIITQDFASEGGNTRGVGWKTGREHHFFSNLERSFFYVLEWADKVIDIREQYPLLDRDLAIQIAESKGIKYPVVNETGTPIVMTTDFMITIATSAGSTEIARTIKPSLDLDNPRTIEKFEIERCYWGKKGIDWGIVTEKDIPSSIAINISKIYSSYWPEDLGFDDYEYMDQLIHILKERLKNGRGGLLPLLNSMDQEYNPGDGTFLTLFKHLIANKKVLINMESKMDFNWDIKDISVVDNISRAGEKWA